MITKKIVVRVVAPLLATSEAVALASPSLQIIAQQQTSYVFISGRLVTINLSAQSGISPYTWNYPNLPSGLSGNQNGTLSGVISSPGYYTITVSCSDSKGISA